MTMTHCGKCGSANGAAARYCRMCGTELNSQAAFSATSTPPGVEFTAPPTPPVEKAPRYHHAAPKKLEERGAVQNSHQDATPTATPGKEHIPLPPSPPLWPNAAAHSPAPQDPKAISEALRRLRAAEPLLGNTARKQQERFDQNSAESSEDSASNKTEPAQELPAAALQQTITQRPSATPAAPVGKAASTKPTPPATSAKPVFPARPTSTPAPALLPSPMSRRAANQSTSSSSARNSGSLSSPVPPQGPASVLVQASGLKTQSNLGSQLLFALLGLLFVLAAGTYFLMGDRPVAPGRGPELGRNLVRAQDQSAELVNAGRRHLERGDFVAAIDNFRGALELNPNDQAALLRLAQTQASMGQSDEALKNYQALLQLTPDHLDARLQVAELHSARSNWSAAYDEYQRIIAYDQNSPQAVTALAAIEKRMPSKPVESAVAEASPLHMEITPTPLPPPAATAQARLSLESERLASAGSIEPPTVSRSPEETPADPRGLADGHKKRGVRYVNIRDYRGAINEFQIALRLTPSDQDLYYLLGSSYHGLGQLALAHDYYRRVASGPYRDVAEAGARQTEKAARAESKRREALRNELKNDTNGKAPRTGALKDGLD